MTANQKTFVADFVAEKPATARVFEQHHIDYCCNGQKTLEEACTEAGVSTDALLAELNETPIPAETRDWRSAPLAELADHIVKRHHTYLRSTLPSVSDKLGKVIEAHGDRHGALLGRLREIVVGLTAELTQHMMKEEMVLFPLVKNMEAAERNETAPPIAPGGSVNNPIRMMEDEHDNAGRALSRIRHLTESYEPPPDACNTFRALYQELEELESDLHCHIHLENNILFPRAAQLEAQIHGDALRRTPSIGFGPAVAATKHVSRH